MPNELTESLSRFRLSFVLRNPADPYGPAIFEKVVPPLPDAAIVQFENRIGGKLPASYREFISQYSDVLIHGGQFQDVSVGVFYGLRSDSVESYRLDWKFDVTRGRVSDDWIPITSDTGGNWICLVLKSSNSGSIFWCDHEDPNYTELLARSFDDFIAGIHAP